jgi:hypothetical protein
VIALAVELLGDLQHAAWTVFHAEIAALAPLLQDVDHTTGDCLSVDVEWPSPIPHLILPE